RRLLHRRTVTIPLSICLALAMAVPGTRLLTSDASQRPAAPVAAVAQQVGTATMGVSPASGQVTVGTPFTVTMQVDGGGQLFNTVAASVTVSGPVTIQSLALATSGSCSTFPFVYLVPPTVNDPSFAGGLLGATAASCTLYTMTLNPTAAGTISV